jgi:hypothetical protein
VTIGEAYGLLGLDASSTTPDEAQGRFRDLIRANHPDGKPSREQARANETTRAIVEAYNLLRNEGFPRLAKAETTGSHYERQAAAPQQSADPLAWVDEVWRESVRSETPEAAIAKAILRAAWWGLIGAVLLLTGIFSTIMMLRSLPGSLADRGWLGILFFLALAATGARFALATWSMARDVVRYWKVFRHIAAPTVVSRVRLKIAVRLCLAVGVPLLAYVALLSLNH